MADDVLEIIKRLKKHYPSAGIALRFSNPLELLVATILSAQCTDERVNQVTSELFKKYRAVEDYARADTKSLEVIIRPTGFYHNKAAHIKHAAQMIEKCFGGKVPQKMEELLSLPGVARKTANVVLSNAFHIDEGIVVDTHVRRIAQRLGLTRNDNPEKIEQDLLKQVPHEDWCIFSHLIQSLGRTICTARKPGHSQCPLFSLCPSREI